MKVITECTISMRTLQTIGERSYEYIGSIAECKGGGGGGSTGSGAIAYPAFMEAVHADWLNNTGADNIASSVTDIMNAALGNSPWVGQVAYDPGADITAFEAAITAFAAMLAGIVDTTDWDTLYTQAVASLGAPAVLAVVDEVVADKVVGDIAVLDKAVGNIVDTSDVLGITEAMIVADVAAFADQLDDEITTKILPRFRGGMRDINAVVSSAFPIGEAIIESFRNREVAKHTSTLRLSAEHKNADIDVRNEELHLDVRKTNVGKDVEIGRANLGKDVEIGKVNLSKGVEIERANLVKDIEIGKANLSKDVEVGTINIRSLAEYKRMYLEGSSQMLRLMLQRISWHDGYMRTVIEGKRIKIVARKEQLDEDMKIDEYDAVWDLEVFTHGANVLAAISGGIGDHHKQPSQLQSALGGVLSGAAMGAMMSGGNPYAVAGGAALGLASAFL